MELKEQLTSLLTEPNSKLKTPRVELEKIAGGKVGGFVVSRTFVDMSQIDRQNMVWTYLETKLSKPKLMKVVSLITVTPMEFNVNH